VSPSAFPLPPARADRPRPGERLLEALLSGRRILVAGHLNPDGDSVGSAVALALALRNMGREVTVSLNGVVAASLDFLLKPKGLFRVVPYKDVTATAFDKLVLVDCQSPDRVWPSAPAPPAAPPIPLQVVDHHITDLDPAYYEASLIDPAASATSELVFKILAALQVAPTPAIVEALLSGLVSDTGSFSQGNATAESLRQAAELVALGGDLESINQALRRDWPLSRFRLMTMALQTLRLHHDGRMATMMVTDEMLKRAESSLGETEGLVEHTLILAGVRLGALAKVNGRGRTRVSLRGRAGTDVRELAGRLGGGGHAQASAYIDDDPDPEKALQRLLPLAGCCLKGEPF
jgi:phosphoesterase RecJ-like protein